ncbi:MAG: MscL family protein [Candidatus Woesearchaeota archaeon]
MVKKHILEFRDFLREYALVGMALAFVMGAAAKDLVKSLVNDIVMPFIVPVIPGEVWQEASFTIGSIVIKWGSFLSTLISFLVLALVVFIIAKKILKEETVKKK